MTYYITNNTLAHHGIKGQKWGVRRYQNPDGTLTEKGKKHYSVGYRISKDARKIGKVTRATGALGLVTRTGLNLSAGPLAGTAAGNALITANLAGTFGIKGAQYVRSFLNISPTLLIGGTAVAVGAKYAKQYFGMKAEERAKKLQDEEKTKETRGENPNKK